MSLISLLVALAAQRSLSSSGWQFDFYFRRYCQLANKYSWVGSPWRSSLTTFVFLLLPVIAAYFLLTLIDDSVLHLVASTLLLLVCFGCSDTRECYKRYLTSAFRGEPTTCDLIHQQLLQDKNLSDMSFGQILVWLNFRYFIAIMFFFVLFGAPGALFYRLLLALIENAEQKKAECESEMQAQIEENNSGDLEQELDEEQDKQPISCQYNAHTADLLQRVLLVLEWPLVRVIAFGYMLVGHFSKAFPIWLENIFNVNQAPAQTLLTVAEKSEDFMIDEDDCTAEPCILVRLAKRTLLLFLAILSLLIITGILQ